MLICANVHFNLICGLKGRLHSRFLRPLSCPRAQPLPLLFLRDHIRESVRYPVRDGANAQQLPLLFLRDHIRDRAKEAVGYWRHCGRDNGCKKRECRRPLIQQLLDTCHCPAKAACMNKATSDEGRRFFCPTPFITVIICRRPTRRKMCA
jgi:hypothetical protein